MTTKSADIQTVLDANLPEMFKGLKIIDSDTHFSGSPDMYSRNAPAAMKDRIPQQVERDGKTIWELNGEMYAGIGAVVINEDGGKLKGQMSYLSRTQMHKGAENVAVRMKTMEDDGMYATIAFTNGGLGDGSTVSPQDRLELLKLYNTYLMQVQAESNNRIMPMAVLPVWDIDETVKEMKRLTDLGVKGYSVQDHPEKLEGIPGYLHDRWAPFWEHLNSTGQVLNFHLGGGGVFNAFDAPWVEFGFERNLAITATMFFQTNAITVANFVMSGIFDTYENVKIVSTESGVGWIPFTLESLEYQFDQMVDKELSMSKRRPKEYFLDHIYSCFWFERTGVKYFVEALGANNLMSETDYPHPTCLWPSPMEYQAETMRRAGVTPAQIKRMMQDNAAELYNIEV